VDMLSAATPSNRATQYCCVCFKIRRQSGSLVDGHQSNGFCPVANRKGTKEEKRELRRRRQKNRRSAAKLLID